MNWWKRAQSDHGRKVGDLFSNLGAAGRLSYPISEAKKVPGKGEWILDMSKAPEMSKPVGEVEVGEGVWDYNLNVLREDAKPMWTVEWVDEEKGTLTVVPTEDNPLYSGIGAGGRELNDFDYLVQSGEWEKEAIDRVLGIIGSKSYHQPADVSYVLLGTVPMRFGANGAEGGWYNAHDTRSNRGGMRGMNEEEIVMRDAAALKKMGFTLPVGALEGKMDAMHWTDFVNRGSMSRSKDVRFDSEDGSRSLEELVTNERNPKVARMMFERLTHSGSGADEERVADVVKRIGEKKGGDGDQDPYFMLKEDAIGWAKRRGRHDLILPFADSEDSDVSASATRALAELGAADPVALMRKARRMKAVYGLLYIADKAGRQGEALEVLEERMGELRSPRTDTDGYYAEQILRMIPQMKVDAQIKGIKAK